jgi:alpha-beta hydrolase superfamily lysophospholipase
MTPRYHGGCQGDVLPSGAEAGNPSAVASHDGHRRWLAWLAWVAGGLLVVVAVVVVLLVVLTRNPEQGDFYEPPDEVAGEPGTILRSERDDDGLPRGARGWRVLYSTTDEDGESIAVSGLIVLPEGAGENRPHPVLAWAHGTTGIARACAPSLTDEPLEGIPDMSGPLGEGWALALTDYPGLGTPGPHPYLVGESEGRAVLDSVRAAHRLVAELDDAGEGEGDDGEGDRPTGEGDGLALSDDYAVWGHSQGGHAALFAGQLAPDHLPELDLAGVAALAPATRLRDNLAAVEGTEAGTLLTVLAVESWSRYYPGVSTDILAERARRPAGRLAETCLNQPSRYRIPIAGLALPTPITDRDVTEDPAWVRLLDRNAPAPDGVPVPVLVTQGLDDRVVDPGVTERWVADRCATGAPTDWRTHGGVDHGEIVGPGGEDALDWTRDRFAGEVAADRCSAG